MLEKNYLTKVKIVEDYRGLKKGLTLNIKKPFYVIAGDNGCGKSSLLDALRDKFKVKDTSFYKQSYGDKIDTTFIKDTPVKYYDFHADDRKFSGSFGEDIMSQIQAQRASSGQANLIQFIGSKVVDAEKSLIILDEPCRGLSIKTQWKFLNLFIKLLSKDNQLIISTHSAIFMRYAEVIGQLYSLEHLKEFKKFVELEDIWMRESY